MSLPQMSKKRIAEIQAGKRNPNGTLKISAEELRAKQDKQTQRIRDAIFGGTATAKSEDRAKAKAKAWVECSKYIRLRDADEKGICTCVTCGRCAHWKAMDAGHFITRAKEATLFDPKNIHAQCGGCNRWQGGKMLEHELAVDRIHGAGTAAMLKIKAVQACKRTVDDYQRIAQEFRGLIAQIAIASPGKFTQP